MGFETCFTHTQVVQLPLPEPTAGQTEEDVIRTGMKMGLSLLHDADIMLKHESHLRDYNRIESSNSKAVNVHAFVALFNAAAATAAANAANGTTTTSNSNGDDASEYQKKLNPDPGPWHHFEVFDKIPVVAGITKQIVFYSAFRYNDDGTEVFNDVGSSVTLYLKYQLSTSGADPRCITMTEYTRTNCSKLLSWYIKSTMSKSHEQVNAFIKEKFVEGMRGKAWV